MLSALIHLHKISYAKTSNQKYILFVIQCPESLQNTRCSVILESMLYYENDCMENKSFESNIH